MFATFIACISSLPDKHHRERKMKHVSHRYRSKCLQLKRHKLLPQKQWRLADCQHMRSRVLLCRTQLRTLFLAFKKLHSASTFKHKLKHFYFSHYRTECVRGRLGLPYFTVNALYKKYLLTFFKLRSYVNTR